LEGVADGISWHVTVSPRGASELAARTSLTAAVERAVSAVAVERVETGSHGGQGARGDDWRVCEASSSRALTVDDGIEWRHVVGAAARAA
jgi:hypothetical protein